MTLLITAVLLGILLGFLGGILPGLGNTVIILVMAPVLFGWPPEITLLFYAVCIQSANFSSTVSSINFGLLGDITGAPALRERHHLLLHNKTLTALKFSAVSSLIAGIVGVTILVASLLYLSFNTFFLRTEFKFFFICLILLLLLFWPKNRWYTNVVLILFGSILGLIGHHEHFFSLIDFHFLTFRMPSIYSGIPMIAVLSSFLAFSAILKLLDLNIISSSKIENVNTNERFPILSSIRGIIIGSILGIVPMIGTMISSNVAWFVERWFKPGRQVTDSLARLSAAESANNSSSITVLAPLLLLGLAIIPSEMLLLSVLETRAWIPNDLKWTVGGLNLYHWLALSVITASIMSYFLCYTMIVGISNVIKNNFTAITIVTVLLLVSSVAYSGYQVDNIVFFLTTFFLCSLLVLINKNVDFMPVVVGYLMIDEVLASTRVLVNLYF